MNAVHLGNNLPKELVIVRHAHRHTVLGRHLDNGLSKKGTQQTHALCAYWYPLLTNQSISFVSSPKLRCIETLKPLAQLLNARLEVSELLDEQNHDLGESDEDFYSRVSVFFDSLSQIKAETVFICSHGDWIPTFYQSITNRPLFLKKGGWVVNHHFLEKLKVKCVYRGKKMKNASGAFAKPAKHGNWV